MFDAPKAAASLAQKLSSRCKEITAAESILGIVVNAWAFLGSGLVCLAIYRNMRLRTIPNMYVLSYALIDLLMSILVMPLSLGVIMKGEWISTVSVCQFQGYIILVLGCLMMLTMTLMAIDRYFATVRPVQYTYFFKRRYVVAAIALCWLSAFAVSLFGSVSGRSYAFHPGSVVCGMDLTEGDINYRPASLFELFFVILPLFIIAVCYWRVYVKITSNQQKSMTLFNEEEDVTKLFAALVMAILICCSPHLLINIVDAFTTQYSLPRSLYFTCSTFIGVSCCIKPIILCIFDVDFKAEFKRILTFRRSRRIDVQHELGAKKKPENPKTAPEKRKYFFNEQENEKPAHKIVEVQNVEKPKPKAEEPKGIPEIKGQSLDKGMGDGRQSRKSVYFQHDAESTKPKAENPQKTPEMKRYFMDEGTDGRESRITVHNQYGQRIRTASPQEAPEKAAYLFEETAEERKPQRVDIQNGEKQKRKTRRKKRGPMLPMRQEDTFLI